MKVQGKVVVVTGAGSGMGRELALELVRRGAKVAALDMRPEGLLETAELVKASSGDSESIATFELNVTDSKAVAALPALIKAKLGETDILINNAGIIQPFVRINELTAKQAENVMAVNFTGPFAMVKAFLPALLAKKSGHILNVSSMGAYAPVPGQSVYGASKAALKLFTEGLRSELVGTGVGVTIVFPGAIATNIAQNSGISVPADAAQSSSFKTTAASVAAKAMVDAIEANKPRICIGSDAKLLDFISRLNPVYAANMIAKQMGSLLK